MTLQDNFDGFLAADHAESQAKYIKRLEIDLHLALYLLLECHLLHAEIGLGGPWAPGGDFDGEITALLDKYDVT